MTYKVIYTHNIYIFLFGNVSEFGRPAVLLKLGKKKKDVRYFTEHIKSSKYTDVARRATYLFSFFSLIIPYIDVYKMYYKGMSINAYIL